MQEVSLEDKELGYITWMFRVFFFLLFPPKQIVQEASICVRFYIHT